MVSLKGEIHVFGGIAEEGLADQHWIFDGATWRQGKATPAPMFAKFAIAGVQGNSLYLFAMHFSAKYDATTDSWSTLSSPPAQIAMPSTIAIDGKLLVLGGLPVGGARPSPILWTYDIRTDPWAVFQQ